MLIEVKYIIKMNNQCYSNLVYLMLLWYIDFLFHRGIVIIKKKRLNTNMH